MTTHTDHETIHYETGAIDRGSNVTDTDNKKPEMPELQRLCTDNRGTTFFGYMDEQMQAYGDAREAWGRAQALEDAANRADDYSRATKDLAWTIADDIRSLT